MPKRCKLVSSPRSFSQGVISHVMMATNGAEFEAGSDPGKRSISAQTEATTCSGYPGPCQNI